MINNDYTEYALAHAILSNVYEKRSGLSYMVHVDQGLEILEKLGADLVTMKAFCLHPLTQDTKMFLNTMDLMEECSPMAVALAVEYRQVANKGSRHNPNWFPIELSVVPRVNIMLIADKVQNKFSYDTFTKPEDKCSEIDHYFISWLTKLNISKKKYDELTKDLRRKEDE